VYNTSVIKKNDNDVTLNDLAKMVARGFENVPTKQEVNNRFDIIDSKFSVVDNRLGKLEYKVDEIFEILQRFEEGDILDLQQRIKILERTVKAMSKKLVTD